MDENEDITLEDELATEISELFSILKELQVGSEEWLAVVKTIDTLYKWRVECAKVEQERLIEEARADREEKARKQSKKERNKELAINTILTLSGIGIPAVIFMHCFTEGMKFEQTGTFTTGWMRLLTKLPKPNKLG